MKFSLDTSPAAWATAQQQGTSITDAVQSVLELGIMADACGIDSMFVLEDPDGWDAFGVLHLLASRTGHLRLGTGVTNPYYRHPAQLAASLSTLDIVSNGRAFLGLGRGQPEWYNRGMGMPWGNPLHKLGETIHLLRQWFQPPHTATSPPYATEFGLNNWRRVIAPVQKHLPIYIAAVGPHALKLAAEHADGVIFNDLASRTFMRNAIRDVKQQASEAGRDPERLEFFARAQVQITDDPEAVYERRKATVAMIHVFPGMERLLETEGYDTDSIIERVREVMGTYQVLARGGAFEEMREAGDLAAAKPLIPTELMHELVVAGSAAHVRSRLQEFEEIGVTHTFLASPDSRESLEQTLSALRS